MNIIQREYVNLRSQRVALRRRLEHLFNARMFSPQNRYGPDGYDNQIWWTEAALRGTEKRWTELCILLKKPLPGPPIKLDVPRRTATTTRP